MCRTTPQLVMNKLKRKLSLQSETRDRLFLLVEIQLDTVLEDVFDVEWGGDIIIRLHSSTLGCLMIVKEEVV